MAKTIKYTGTQRRWPELATTGKQSTWFPGQQEERSDTEAAQLLATGLFFDVDSINQTPAESALLSALVSQDGILPRADTTFPAERVTLSGNGCVCASPCQIERVRCVSGTSVALTVYDNPAASSGTTLYSGTLSAGQEAAITAPIRAINGVRAVFASGSFDFYVSQEI